MSSRQTPTDASSHDGGHPNSYSRRTVLRGLAATGTAAVAVQQLTGRSRAIQPSLQAQPTGPLADPEQLETFLDGVLKAQLEAHDIPGATVAIVDDEMTFTKGYGVQDIRSDAPVAADETLFRIGSVSKLFTWTALMQGVEAGRLDLETNVNEYLNGITIPDTYDQPITLEHLVTHTAGFEERLRGTFVLSEDNLRPLSAMLRDERPARVRPPGEFAAYSNYGAALAGHIAASSAGLSFGEYVDERVFEPLGMDQSTFTQPVSETIDGTLSKGYTTQNGRYVEGDFEFVGMPPTGSMSATATDIARFMRAHLQGGVTDQGHILTADSIAAMHRRRFGHDDRLNGMCFGFYELSRNNVRIVGHGGDTEQFHSLLALLPDHGVGLFVSYNSPGGVEARDELLSALLDEYYPTDGSAPRPDGEPTRARDITGTYRALRTPYTTSEKLVGVQANISVSVDGNGRLVTTDSAGSTQWIEVDELYFEAVDGSDALVFGESGSEVTHLFFDSRPPSAYERLTPREQPITHAVIAVVALLVFLGAVLGWTATALWRWYQGQTRDRPTAPLQYTRVVAGLAAVSYLVFAIGLVGVVVTDPLTTFLGDPLRLQVILLLPLVGVLASVATLVLAGVAWRQDAWSRLLRVQYAAVGVAGVVFALVLAYWNLLWYQM